MVEVRLQALLDDRNMSQRELSRISGVRQETISRICRQYIDRIEIAHIDAICEALDVEPGDWIVRVRKPKLTVVE